MEPIAQPAQEPLPLKWRLIAALLPSVTTAACILWLHSGWAAILAYHATIVAGLALSGRARTLGTFHGRWTGLGAACCILAALPGPVLYFLLPSMVYGSIGGRLTALALNGPLWLVFMPWFAFVNPMIEETYWRGLLRTSGRRAGVLDLLFGGYHLFVLPLFLTPPYVLLGAIVLILSARTWRAVTDEAGGLWPAICSHMLADIGIIAAVALHR